MDHKVISLPTRPTRRQVFSDQLAVIVTSALKDQIPWQQVVNDLINSGAGLLAVCSDHPAKDLIAMGAAVKNRRWQEDKRRWFAANVGVKPEDVTDEQLAAGPKAVDGQPAACQNEGSNPLVYDGLEPKGE